MFLSVGLRVRLQYSSTGTGGVGKETQESERSGEAKDAVRANSVWIERLGFGLEIPVGKLEIRTGKSTLL